MDLSEGSQASEPSVGAYLRRKFDEVLRVHSGSNVRFNITGNLM